MVAVVGADRQLARLAQGQADGARPAPAARRGAGARDAGRRGARERGQQQHLQRPQPRGLLALPRADLCSAADGLAPVVLVGRERPGDRRARDRHDQGPGHHVRASRLPGGGRVRHVPRTAGGRRDRCDRCAQSRTTDRIRRRVPRPAAGLPRRLAGRARSPVHRVRPRSYRSARRSTRRSRRRQATASSSSPACSTRRSPNWPPAAVRSAASSAAATGWRPSGGSRASAARSWPCTATREPTAVATERLAGRPTGSPAPAPLSERRAAFGSTVALTVTLALAAFLALMAIVVLLAHPQLAGLGPSPGLVNKQNQTGKSLLYLVTFAVILPTAVILVPRLADAIAAGPQRRRARDPVRPDRVQPGPALDRDQALAPPSVGRRAQGRPRRGADLVGGGRRDARAQRRRRSVAGARAAGAHQQKRMAVRERAGVRGAAVRHREQLRCTPYRCCSARSSGWRCCSSLRGCGPPAGAGAAA